RNNMKTTRLLFFVAILFLAALPASTFAQFWDPDGATVGTSVSGNWDTTTANWTTTVDSGVNTVWTQGAGANFGVAANYTVTVTEPITVGAIGVTGSAGTLTIAGTSPNFLSLGGFGTIDTGQRSV